MKTYQLKIEPHPDFRRLEKELHREGEPDRVPFFELFSNITEPVLRALGRWQNAPAIRTARNSVMPEPDN